jgi:hypothetical protein
MYINLLHSLLNIHHTYLTYGELATLPLQHIMMKHLVSFTFKSDTRGSDDGGYCDSFVTRTVIETMKGGLRAAVMQRLSLQYISVTIITIVL